MVTLFAYWCVKSAHNEAQQHTLHIPSLHNSYLNSLLRFFIPAWLMIHLSRDPRTKTPIQTTTQSLTCFFPLPLTTALCTIQSNFLQRPASYLTSSLPLIINHDGFSISLLHILKVYPMTVVLLISPLSFFRPLQHFGPTLRFLTHILVQVYLLRLVPKRKVASWMSCTTMNKFWFDASI